MELKKLATFVAMCLVVTLTGAAAHAAESVIASTDVWIRSISPNTTFEDDDVAIRGSASDTRYGLIEFDLSGIAPFQLGNVSLVLTSSDVYTTQLTQTAFLINTTGGTPASSMTWNTYQAEYQGSEVYAFEQLGVATVGGPLLNGQTFTTNASSNDVATIQNVFNSGGLLTFVFKPASTNSDINWDDDNTAYGPGIRAVLNLAGGLGDFNNDGVVDIQDYGILRNHMQAHLDGPVSYSMGDINFDGRIDLDDFGQFKGIYPGGASALFAALNAGPVVEAVPEPASFALSACGLAVLVMMRGSRAARRSTR